VAAERLYASMRMERTLFAGILGAARVLSTTGAGVRPCHGVVDIHQSLEEVGCN
jgi:hypothetical protein